jgi:disulfide bond formation protein DsbB
LLRSQTWLAAGCAVACFGLLAIGEILQHGFGMQPCSWCVLQRLVFLLVGISCAAAALAGRMRWLRTATAGLGGVLSVAGFGAAVYQQTVASKSASCLLTLADRIVMALSLHELAPWMFMPTAPCNEANAPLLGIPFAIWSATAFAGLALASASIAFRSASGR